MEEKPNVLEVNVAHLQSDVTEIKGRVTRLEEKVDGAIKDLHAKIDGVARDLHAKIDGVAKDLNAKIDAVAETLRKKISALDLRFITLAIVLLGAIAGSYSYTERRFDKLSDQVHVQIQALDQKMSAQYAVLLSKLSERQEKPAAPAKAR